VYAAGSTSGPGTRIHSGRLGVSYKNGNEESEEESGRKEEEVSPSPLYRYRYVFLTKASATGFRCARFLFTA
jgi:hypothetical protein